MNKILILLLLCVISCNEEDIPGPCRERYEACKTLLARMDQAKTEKERWQIEQFYLSEKHDLDFCLKSN